MHVFHKMRVIRAVDGT